MGASGWEYVTPYEGSVEDSLATLHAQVFQELYGDGSTYATLDELWQDQEFMYEEGTHSILDISCVVHTLDAPSTGNLDDYGTLRPLAPDRTVHHFGTDRPTPERFKEVLAQSHEELGRRRPMADPATTLIDECVMRWTGLFVVLYTGDEPSHVGIFGFSGD